MLQTLKTYATLGPQDRLAMVYANLKELRDNNQAHWQGAVHRQAKCLCVTAPGTRRHAVLQSTKKRLRNQGLQPEQVCFINPGDCLRRGRLSLPLLLKRLSNEYRLAQSQGFRACDICCDMLALHSLQPRLSPLLDALTNGFQDQQPSALLLHFPKRGLPPDVFQTLLQFGSLVLLDGRIRRNIRRLPATSPPARRPKHSLELLHGIERYNRVLDQNAALFALFEQHGPAFCVVDDQARMIHWNRAFAGLTGLDHDREALSLPLSAVFHPGSPPAIGPALPDQGPCSTVGELVGPGGEPIPVTLATHVVPDARTQNTCLRLVTVHELNPDPGAKDALSRAEKQYQRIFELSRRGLVRVAADGTILHANQTFSDMLGYRFQEALHGQGMRWWKANCTVAEQYLTLFREIRESGSVSRYELEILDATKQPRQLLLDAFAADDRKDGELSFIAVVEDVTEQKKSERQLLHQAFHDQLTELPNKALLMNRMAMALQRTKRCKNNLFALAFLDIDDFKRVTTLGHVLGDQVLVKVARKIMRSVRNVDTVSRFGGDEFVILLDGIEDEHEAVRILDRVREELALPMPLSSGQELVCTVSAGLVLSPGYASTTDMLRDADTAMYKAKTGNKGNIHLFKLSRRKTSPTADISSRDLSKAMDHGEFRLHYQPIFRIAGSRIVGFEALIRWQHPGHGLLHPAEFLSLAEKSGHILALAHWVLGTACAQMRTWQLNFPCDPPLTICTNLSAEQFMYPGIVQSVQSALEATGLDERSLKLEFSRTAMARSGNIGELLMRLKELDVQLSIDDFGMGYSTLLHLQRYPFVPIDTLKIDRSVISRLTDHADYQEMVWTTIMLAHGLGVEVVAEGVETSEQLALLAEMNCDHAQGYLFSKPLESDPAGKFLQSHIHKKPLMGKRTENPRGQTLART
ncbi:MAG TPA: EAL domain-containing protein [Desulfonatronum sp.]|nr:EAL domain-containing protein [Desulfonatronum sp.]